MHISVGLENLGTIALFPGQIIEFPSRSIATIKASAYGKVSQYLVGQNAELSVGATSSRLHYVKNITLLRMWKTCGEGRW